MSEQSNSGSTRRQPRQVQTQTRLERPTMTAPKFKRGDLVRHRASGEVAVVVGANYYQGFTDRYLHSLTEDEAKGYEFTGTYDLDRGFEHGVSTVEEFLLEAVEAEAKEVRCNCGCGLLLTDPEPEGESGP